MWKLLKRALVSGTVAAILSTLIVTLFSATGEGTAAAGTNASSQWLWGEEAHIRSGFSLRYTLLGFVIHHASSLLWACVYELVSTKSNHFTSRFLIAIGVTIFAYFVDYYVVPPRLSPGFDRHISGWGVFAAYSAFVLGLWLPALYRLRNRHPSRRQIGPE